MIVHRRVAPSIKYADTHLILYSWLERDTVRVKCLAQEHNTVSLARVWTQTLWSVGEHTNHEVTVPPPVCHIGDKFGTERDQINVHVI